MSDEGWLEEEKAKELEIPGIILPNLRDMRIQFIALIEFDLFLGPIVYLKELSRGSKYVEKLKSYQTLSEVYAGLARADIDTLKTLEDEIAIFRFASYGETDITTVLLISCMPESDMTIVQEMGSSVLNRSQGAPELFGGELSKYLREKVSESKKFKSENTQVNITILETNRISKPLEFNITKGLLILDYDTNLIDIRNLPKWYNGKEIPTEDFISYIDRLINNITENEITSILYQNLSFLATKSTNLNIYFFILIDNYDLISLNKIGKWFIDYVSVLSDSWKFADLDEIKISLSTFDNVLERSTDTSLFIKYTKMLIRSKKIKPIFSNNQSIINKNPSYIEKKNWEILKELDGKMDLYDICLKNKINNIDLIVLLEWAKERKLIDYLQE